MVKQLVIDISPAGTVVVDAQGFKGVGCSKASEQIEIVLGGEGQKKRKDKPERFAPADTGSAKNKLTF